MNTPDAATRFHVRYLGGIRWILIMALFFLQCAVYLIRVKRYPLFRFRPASGGYLKTFRLARRMGLAKMVQIGTRRFSSLSLPHSPSAAYDRMVARGGLNFSAAGTPLKQQVDTVILSISRRCELGCKHCYERASISDTESVPIERWRAVIRDIQEMGASIIVLSGGEPMLRFDGVMELLRSADTSLSDFHIHTSGAGVSTARARQLAEAGLVAAAVGLDDVDPERHDALRGRTGAHVAATRAVGMFRDAGILPYLNACVTRPLVRSGDLWKYLEMARSLNVGFIQLLEPRPCGGFFEDAGDHMLTDGDREIVRQFVFTANTHRRYRAYPVVHSVALAESPAFWGCLMGGLSHFHIDGRGNVNPCVFLPVSFGTIATEPFPAIFRRMRLAIPSPLKAECPSLQLAPGIRALAGGPETTPVRYEDISADWSAMIHRTG